MWQPRFRFTVRWLMVAVAIGALLCLALVARRDRDRAERSRALGALFRTRAGKAADIEPNLRMMAASCREVAGNASKEIAIYASELIANYEDELREPSLADPASRAATSESIERARRYEQKWRADAARYERKADYYAAMREKYSLASKRPLLPVEPDPSEPE